MKAFNDQNFGILLLFELNVVIHSLTPLVIEKLKKTLNENQGYFNQLSKFIGNETIEKSRKEM